MVVISTILGTYTQTSMPLATSNARVHLQEGSMEDLTSSGFKTLKIAQCKILLHNRWQWFPPYPMMRGNFEIQNLEVGNVQSACLHTQLRVLSAPLTPQGVMASGVSQCVYLPTWTTILPIATTPTPSSSGSHTSSTHAVQIS